MSHTEARRLLVAAAIMIAATPVSIAHADLVSYSFTAHTTDFGPANDTLIGSFSLDTTVAPQPIDPNVPIQNGAVFHAVRSLTVSVEGLNLTWTGSASDDLFINHHFFPNTPDAFFLLSTQPSGPPFTDSLGRSFAITTIAIDLAQNAGTLFSDASVLPRTLILSNFDLANISFQLSSGETLVSQLTSFEPTPTPLPATLPLFATGLGVLGLLGWRRKKKAAALAA